MKWNVTQDETEKLKAEMARTKTYLDNFRVVKARRIPDEDGLAGKRNELAALYRLYHPDNNNTDLIEKCIRLRFDSDMHADWNAARITREQNAESQLGSVVDNLAFVLSVAADEREPERRVNVSYARTGGAEHAAENVLRACQVVLDRGPLPPPPPPSPPREYEPEVVFRRAP